MAQKFGCNYSAGRWGNDGLVKLLLPDGVIIGVFAKLFQKRRESTREIHRRESRMKAPLKWWGGKYFMVKHLIKLVPSTPGEFTKYVEPYFGGGQLLFARDPEGCQK
jgi:hypothetical protein